MKILVTWIGDQDLKASAASSDKLAGPVASALAAKPFDRAILLANWTPEKTRPYLKWLEGFNLAKLELKPVDLVDPTDFARIYSEVSKILDELETPTGEIPELTFHLSPGTSQMSAMWLLLSKTKYPAELIQSSKEAGVQQADFPFELSAELSPELLKPSDERLRKLSAGLSWGDDNGIEYRSKAMIRLLEKVNKAAPRSVPVLIEGQPGSEKELLARLIHDGSQRRKKPFSVLNCGAIPADEFDQIIFGVGAAEGRGALASDKTGTLYLNEVEALPLNVQARLEMMLDTSESLPRLIVSSRTSLMDRVLNGEFREELYYKLAVLVLKLPPLKERLGDIGTIIEHCLIRVNKQSASEPGYVAKSLSPAAKNSLMQQSWPGNLRELENTLRRLVVWSDTKEISEAEVLDALLPRAERVDRESTILGRSFEEGVDLQEIIAEVARHYILKAIEHSEGNKSTAAKLVGLPSYQTLSNWMKKYGIT